MAQYRNITNETIEVSGTKIAPNQIVELNETVGQSTSGLQPIKTQSQQLLTEAPLGFAKTEVQNG